MIRLALIGEGDAASECLKLAPRLREASLTAIADIKELDGDAFNAVVIGSSADPEANCRFAAAHGKHVLFTAPPESTTEARTLVKECRNQNVLLMGSFLDRFLPSMQTIKQSLDAGQLGDPGLIRTHRWNADADLLADIDLVLWMFSSLPTEVYAVTRWEDHPHDYLQVHLGFPGGGMALIDVSNTLASADGYFSLSLIGSKGAAYADDHHNQQLLLRGDRPVALKAGEGPVGREGDAARSAQLQEFVDAINEQREPAVNGVDEEVALLVTEAAWQSIHRGRTARLLGERYEC